MFGSIVMSEFSDAAVVLVGHGSTLNADSARPTYQHADALRARGEFLQVIECFWKEEPAICGVLRGIHARRVFVVPLFISDGYFTEQVIPRELGFCQNGQTEFPRTQSRGSQVVHYCKPVGTHPSMTQVLLNRAASVMDHYRKPDGTLAHAANSALVIAGHGTGNNENSRKAIEHQVALIQQLNSFAEVHPAFMEEEPKIGDIYTRIQSPHVVMVPFFISDGLHSFEDIPVMLGAAPEDVRGRLLRAEPTWINPTLHSGKWVWYSRSIGDEPGIADVILERVREMARSGAVASDAP
jgi:sirohydrochlorin cobaltochelatase